MKKWAPTILLVLVLTLTAKAQIPDLIPDATPWFAKNSAFHKEFAGKYDLAISHHHEGGWSTQEFYYSILALKDGKWYKIIYTRDKDFGKGQPEAKLEKVMINKHIADSILFVMTTNSFWKLDNNELNKESDGKYYDTDAHRYLDRSVYISDGISDIFEIISKDTYRVTYSYEPEAYLKTLPGLKQRGLFINAKRAFLSVFPNVWQPPVR